MKYLLVIVASFGLACTPDSSSDSGSSGPLDGADSATDGAQSGALDATDGSPSDVGRLNGDARVEPGDSALSGGAMGDGGRPVDAAPARDAAPSIDATPASDATPPIDAAPIMVDAAPTPDAAPVIPDAGVLRRVPVVDDAGDELALLFVGNSYTQQNRLDRVVCALAEQTGRWERVRCEKVTAGGYRITQHAEDAAGDTALGRWLDPQNPDRPQWDAVVLQEQSQIPGFPPNQVDYEGFVTGVARLNQQIEAIGAETALLMTWGRARGDQQNAARYPDYLTMQRHLAAGYGAAAASASTPDRTVHVLPVGIGWLQTHERDQEGDFQALYSGDGSHPAPPGTYLAALVILDYLVAVDPATLGPLASGPEAELANRLRQDAARLVWP